MDLPALPVRLSTLRAVTNVACSILHECDFHAPSAVRRAVEMLGLDPGDLDPTDIIGRAVDAVEQTL